MVNMDCTGWRVVTWFELRLENGDGYGCYDIGGYFTSRELALAAGKHKAFYGADGEAFEVLVLTKDNKSGYLLVRKEIELSLEEEAAVIVKLKAIEKAKSKLSEEEKELLGIK